MSTTTSHPTPAAVAAQLYEKVWNQRDYGAAETLFAADYSHPLVPHLRGGAAKAAIVRGYHGAFPDLQVTVDELVTTDNKVATRIAIVGTDIGGFRGKPPTGRAINAWVVEFLRIEEGLIVEDWIGADWLGVLEQLGLITSPWS